LNAGVIFHIPHASTHIPGQCRAALLLSDAQLDAELLAMTDHFTDVLFSEFCGEHDQCVVAPVSRLIVDMERFSDDEQESMAEKGMGVIYTRTAGGRELRQLPSPTERASLLERYYWPHHEALSRAVAAELDRSGRSLILDCHSFPSRPLPYEFDQSPVRPDFCIGTDTFHTPALLIALLQQQLMDLGHSVAVNAPFAGTMVPAEYYQQEPAVISVMLEINRGLYMDESTGTKSSCYAQTQAVVGEWVGALRGLHRHTGH
jgi:N-formylglutamate deformylase